MYLNLEAVAYCSRNKSNHLITGWWQRELYGKQTRFIVPGFAMVWTYTGELLYLLTCGNNPWYIFRFCFDYQSYARCCGWSFLFTK